jgi:hypothetical protein
MKTTSRAEQMEERTFLASRAPPVSILLWPAILLQGCHVDDEPVLHIAFEEAFVGFIDLLDTDQLDISRNPFFGAKIQHLLRFPNPANGGARQLPPAHDQSEGRHR